MSVMEQQQPRGRRSFTDEFKRDAVSMVIGDKRSIVDVADSLGIGDGTLGNWVRQARVDVGDKAGVIRGIRPATKRDARVIRPGVQRCPHPKRGTFCCLGRR
jgi:transposase-like protein